MNVSPHQQRPTKYPWPGPASAAVVVVALVVILGVAFTLIGGSPADDSEEPSPTGTRIAAARSV